MKICAIICEYNPFHNGHLYQLREAKRLSGADTLLCIMSGNFVQRGDVAIMDKFTRAKHAVQAGADIVIELPTIFATSNAELFAKGAIHVFSSIPDISTLCFGCENSDKGALIQTAEKLLNEPKEVSLKIKEYVGQGLSYAKARAKAWERQIPLGMLTSPNNILGIEYTKALLSKGSVIEILPIQRMGAGYHDETIQENFSSASAIRAGLEDKTNIACNLPDFVFKNLPNSTQNQLDLLEKHAILSVSTEKIAGVCDCTEGLENAFKKAATLSQSLEETLTSSRYTTSRIRRIALQNLLNIHESLIRQSLCNPLYLRVLAVNKDRLDVLSALSASSFPTIIRAHDDKQLVDTAKLCYDVDIYAEQIYSLLHPIPVSKHIFI